ncbi:MAG: DNA mismatch repair endonuclease MutL [Puniceicoccales bacterium]|nr:DNA mismatch repair endonuclease MutL [Puniceicoccales bacterium]
MKCQVRRLLEVVINRVAAGEVVERPSAVVKELVENAIDAGATAVDVDFRRAGKDSISVRDNGFGMSREDALLAVERHATSKIFSIEDLTFIDSFGFRGEALPSIASVSRMTLRTRRKADAIGTEITIEDGVSCAVGECAMEPGTQVLVTHLFQSVPARRKFLRTDQTEANHIIETVRSFAVAFPAVRFHLRHGGRTCFEVFGGDTLPQRIRRLWGNRLEEHLLPVALEGNGRRLRGYVANPSADRWTTPEMHFFINRRAIYSKELREWVLDAYGDFLPNVRSVDCFLFLELPPDQVDVNVHPAKREVRLSHRAELRVFVVDGLKKHLSAVALQKLSPGLPFQQRNGKNFQESTFSEGENFSDPAGKVIGGREGIFSAKGTARGAGKILEKFPVEAGSKAPISDSVNGSGRDGGESQNFEDNFEKRHLPRKEKPDAFNFAAPVITRSRGIINWRYIGKMDSRCALFASDTGLIFLDIRTATIRVLHEKLLREIADPQRQRLLMPIVLDLRRQEEGGEREALEELERIGFSVEQVGSRQFTISALPLWLDEHSGEAFLYDWLIIQRKNSSGLRMEFLAEIAARHQANGRLPATEEEILKLLEDLLHCEFPAVAPDGSAIYFELSNGEIQRRRSCHSF